MSHVLDLLLRMYYNNGTTQGEKDNALSLFIKKCTTMNIDSMEYRRKFCEENNIHDSSVPPRSKPNNHGFGSFSFDINDDMANFINHIYENICNNTYTAYGNSHYGRTRNKNNNEYTDKDRYEQDKNGAPCFGEFKEPIIDSLRGGKSEVLIFSSLFNVNGRWGLKNFCIYYHGVSSRFTIERAFKIYKSFTFTSSGKSYFGDCMIINNLYGIDENGQYHKISI